GVQARGPEVADDLLHARGVLEGGGLLGELALDGLRALVEHLEGAPGGAVARDGVRGQPAAVDVGAEVDAGIALRVEIAGLEAVHAGQGRLVEREARRFRRGGGAVRARRGIALAPG